MIIPITLSSASTSLSSSANPKLPPGLVKISNDEIMLIELQGSLEVELNDPSERNGKLVGKLKMDEATNKPTLLIGHQLLEGKIAALPKPYAILVRTPGVRRAEADTDVIVDSHRSSSSSSTKKKSNNNKSNNDNNAADQTRTDSDEEAMDMDIDDSHNARGPELSREDEDVDLHESGSDAGAGTGTGWAIAGIVKKKIIFSKRPMPVTTKK